MAQETVSTGTDVYEWIGSTGGSWGDASNWEDVTTGADPATSVPGAKDPVVIAVASSAIYEVIGGGGASASLAITGNIDLSGAYTTGALSVGSVQTPSGSGSATYTAGGLALASGSTVSASTISLSDGTIAVSGSGTDLSASGAVTVGSSRHSTGSNYFSGAGGTLSVAAGASFVAVGLDVVNGTLSASGSGTSVTIKGAVTLGSPYSSTSGGYNSGSVGTLGVSGGASVTVTGAITANGENEGYDTISVTGAGSSLTVGGTLTLANDSAYSSYYSASLAVSSGGSVQLAGLVFQQDGSTGYYAGAVSVDSSSSIEIGSLGSAAAGALTVDAGEAVTATVAAAIYGNIVNNGTISETGGVLTLSGALSGSGQIDLGASAGLVLDGTVASSDTIDLTGADATIEIGAQSSYNYQTQSYTYTPYTVSPTITGFDTGDGIIVDDTALTNAVYTATGANTGTLTLFAGTTQVETITLDGDYSGRTFFISPTTNGSSAVSVLARPLGTVPASEAVLQGISTPLPGFSISDANVQATTITVTLAATLGLLSATNSGGGTVTGSGSSTLTLSGTVAQVNADLATLSYLAAETGTDTIVVTSVDSLGSKGLQTSVPVTVLPIAPPTIAAPTEPLFATQGESSAISSISITYPDGAVAGEQVTVTLSDSVGVLSVDSATAGGGGTVTGEGTTSLSISGTLAEVDADLTTLTYSSSTTGSDTVTVSASGTHGGSATPDSFTIDTVAPPQITAPSSAALVQGLAVPLAVSVAEAGSTSGETFTVTLSDTNGLLSATGIGVTGSGSISLSISGSLSDVNAALATLTDADPSSGQDQITLKVTDSFGNAASASIGVTVAPLAPQFIAPSSLTVVEGTATLLGVSVAEPADFVGNSVTATVTDTYGDLSALDASGAVVTVSDDNHALSIVGTSQQVNAALASLTYDAVAAQSNNLIADVADASTTQSDVVHVSESDGSGDSASTSINVTSYPRGSTSQPATSTPLFTAILAMDSYNRGYLPTIFGLSDAQNTQIGNAFIQKNRADQLTGFYALSYSLDGTTYISYRGTNWNTWWNGLADVLFGWSAGAGLLSPQTAEAASFYTYATGQSLTNGPAANVVLTGHSLGGGLAGYIASLTGDKANVYDTMPYGAVALNEFLSENIAAASQNVVLSAVPFLKGVLKGGFLAFLSSEILQGQIELLPAALDLFLNGNIGGDFATAWSTLTGGASGTSYAPFPNGSNITSEYTSGEALSYVRAGAWLAPFVAGLNSGGPIAGALAASAATLVENSASTIALNSYADTSLSDAVNLHSMPLIVLLQYAQQNQLTAWQSIGNNLLLAYDNDSIGAALGLGTSTGDGSPAAQMLTMIAYSAINQGTMPFGDTGIVSLFTNADTLGDFFNSQNAPILPNNNSILSDLADITVEYAGLLAQNADTNIAHDAGVISYDTNGEDLAIDVSQATWTVGLTAPTIEGEADLIANLFNGVFGPGVSQSSVNRDVSSGGINPDKIVIGNDDPSAHTIDLSNDAGTDMIYAGNGMVDVNLGTGTNYLLAGSGTDTITASSGTDTINEGSGTDTVYAGSGTDTIYATSGTDTDYAGSGTATIHAGSGTDMVDITSAGQGLDFLGGSGSGTVDASALTGDETIEVDPGTGSLQVLMGAAETLMLDDAARFVGSIYGFASGNVIDLAGIFASAATAISDNTLSIRSDAGTLSLQLAGGSYSDDFFQTTPDGNGGTDITLATLEITPADPTINEDGSTETFTVTRFGNLSQAETVYVSTTDGSTVPGESVNDGDFVPLSGDALTFAAGSATTTFDVTLGDNTSDTSDSESKIFGVEITNDTSSDASPLATDSFTLVLPPSPPPPPPPPPIQPPSPLPPPPPGPPSAGALGCPHFTTFSGQEFDFQGAGEFVAVRSTAPGNTFQVQIRIEPEGSLDSSVSIITQIAVAVGGDRVTFAANRDQVVWVDGAPVSISQASPVFTLKKGTVTEVSTNEYVVALNTGEKVIVNPFGDGMGLSVALASTDGPGSVQGFFGPDEGQADDFELPDGTVLKQPLSQSDLYQTFANAWRITDSSSLLDYGPGQDTETFTITQYPREILTLADLPPDLVAAAAKLVAAAGITDPVLAADAEFDYITMGDPYLIAHDAAVAGTDFTSGTPITVTEQVTPPPSIGVVAGAPTITETSGGTTAVTFVVNLTGPATADTVVDYSVSANAMAGIADGRNYFSAADFGGTLPSGSMTISAGKSEGTITIDVPASALGTATDKWLQLFISSPGGANPIYGPNAQTDIINSSPVAGPSAEPTFTLVSGPTASSTENTPAIVQSGTTYTVNLGRVLQNSALPALQFAVANMALPGADGLSGRINSITGSGFQVSGTQPPATIAAGQAYNELYFQPDTSALGAQSESITLQSNDVNETGYSTRLPDLTLIVEDTVVAPAIAKFSTNSVQFQNVRVGASESQTIAVTNSAAQSDASLDVTMTAGTDTTAAGSVLQLAPGATDSTDLSVGLDTATAGLKTGTVTLDVFSDIGGGAQIASLPSPTVSVSGAVYREAAGAIAPAQAIVHVRDSGTENLVVSNSDPADGYSEGLRASLVSSSGAISVSGGPSGLIAAGSSDSSSLTASFSTAASGIDTGTVVTDFVSDGTGTSGLASVDEGTTSTPISIQVDNYAVAALAVTGSGTLAETDPTHYTLDLGSVTQGAAAQTATLAILNTASGPYADLLQAAFAAATGQTSAFTTSLAAVNGIAFGASTTAGTVSLATGAAGTFSETVHIDPTGYNSGGYSAALTPITLTVDGTVLSSGQTYTLTKGVDTIVGGAGDNTVIAASGTLSRGDEIDGGNGGSNKLVLQGAGTFDLQSPATLTGIQTVDASEQQVEGSTELLNGQVVQLRDGTNLTVDVTSGTPVAGNPNPEGLTIYGADNSDTINLGAGEDRVFVGGAGETVVGGGGNDRIIVASENIGVTIDGGAGNSILRLVGGGTAVMGSNITQIDKVALTGPASGETQPDWNFTANSIGDLEIFGSGGNDKITVGNASQIVRTGGGNVTVFADAADAGALIIGGSGQNTLEITGGGSAVLNARDARVTVKLDEATTLTIGNQSSDLAVVGSSGNDVFIASGEALRHVTTLDGGGGADTLQLVGGGEATLGAGVTGLSKVVLEPASTGQAQPGWDFTANATHGLEIDGSGGDDLIAVGDASQTVDTGNGNVTVIADASTAGALIVGGSGTDTLEIKRGGTAVLNSGDQNLTIRLDQATNLTLGGGAGLVAIGSGGRDRITAGGAGQVLTGGGGADILVGFAGGGTTFRDTAANLNRDTIGNFAATGDEIDITDFGIGVGAQIAFAERAGSSQGILAISDGTHMTKIVLLGQFIASGFHAANDGAGGTLISYSAPEQHVHSLAAPV